MLRYASLAAVLLQGVMADGAEAQEGGVAAAGAGVAQAQADPDVKIVYYDVAGTDARSIAASLAAATPTRPDGKKAAALTTYDIRYSAVQRIGAAQCTIAKASVQMLVTVHLPRLVDDTSVPAPLLARWKPFAEALRVHEQGHVKILTDHRAIIEASLTGAGCDALEATIEAAKQRIGLLQQAYDRETKDGATQGAVLRWPV